MQNIQIRPADDHDIPALYRFADDMAARHEPQYFERCLAEQAEGRRLVLLASAAGVGLSGYVQLNWQPLYAPFRRLGLPEIQDLNVHPRQRRQGIGARLIAACEEAARQAGKSDIGIGVGLHAGFGAAQRLYVRAGYMPDGLGLVHDDMPVRAGESRIVDNLLSIKLTKQI